MSDVSKAEEALFARLKEGPLTVWAVLREDTYETIFGDGYYAYVSFAYLEEGDARRTASTSTGEGINWHVRRFDLLVDGPERYRVSPAPTVAEPTKLADIAAALRASGLI